MSHTDSYIDFRAFERDYSLSRRTFFKLITDGKLPAYKPSKRKTLVKRSDVDRGCWRGKLSLTVLNIWCPYG